MAAERATDALTAAGVAQHLKKEHPLVVEACIDSTNRLCRDMARQGAAESTVVMAARQTAGRGRLGRSFYSPQDTGLYISILLRPQLAAEKAIRITTAAAVAVCEAIAKETGRQPGIKWVNDLFLDGRKVCGILTESAFDGERGGLAYAVLGIGVNVYPPEGGFPEELQTIAGSVTEDVQPGLRDRLAAAIVNEFDSLYAGLDAGAHMESYRARSIAVGRQVKVIRGDTQRAATVLDVDEECRLLVRWQDDGKCEALSTGEISVRL